MRRYGLYFTWLISCIALVGSLYVSQILDVEPCLLCWYQRICIYPLVIIVGIAAFRGFIGIVPYVLPLVIMGFLIALYQVLLQEIPGWEPFSFCGAAVNCTEKHDIGLGPITLPMLSVLGFFLMTFFLSTAWIADKWAKWRQK